MRVLFACPFVPWPLRSGGAIRTYHLIEAAAREVELHLCAVLEPGQTRAHAEPLERVCASVQLFEREAAGPVDQLRRAKIERWFHSPSLRAALARELASGRYDVLHLDELLLARLPPISARTPIVQHHHKLDSVLFESITGGRGPQRHFDLWKLRRLEAEAARRTPHHVLCSAEDRAILESRYPGLECAVVPSGFDPRHFTPSAQPPAREPELLVFVGSMSYEPNVDAVARFARNVLPSVLRERPHARLAIVGRAPAPEVRALASEHIEIVGEVADVRPWLERAALVVVPLRVGGGTRLKIVEALAMGAPVLSTSIGAEGLELTPGREIALADEPPAFARAVLELLSDEARRTALARAGQERVRALYPWPTLAHALVEHWRAAARGAESTDVRR